MLPFVTKKCSMTLLGCVSIRNVPWHGFKMWTSPLWKMISGTW